MICSLQERGRYSSWIDLWFVPLRFTFAHPPPRLPPPIGSPKDQHFNFERSSFGTISSGQIELVAIVKKSTGPQTDHFGESTRHPCGTPRGHGICHERPRLVFWSGYVHVLKGTLCNVGSLGHRLVPTLAHHSPSALLISSGVVKHLASRKSCLAVYQRAPIP